VLTTGVDEQAAGQVSIPRSAIVADDRRRDQAQADPRRQAKPAQPLDPRHSSGEERLPPPLCIGGPGGRRRRHSPTAIIRDTWLLAQGNLIR